MSNQVGFVKTYFHDDASGPSPWGPSLYTMMHTDYLSQLDASTHYLRASGDNDSGGTCLFDDETPLAGLAAYSYIPPPIADTPHPHWPSTAHATCRLPAPPGRSPPPPAAQTPGGKRTAGRPTRPIRGRAATLPRSSARSLPPGRWPGRPRPCSSRWSPRAWPGPPAADTRPRS